MCEIAPETRWFCVQRGDGGGALVSDNNDARLENGSNHEGIHMRARRPRARIRGVST